MKIFDPAAYLSSLNIDIMHFGLKTVSDLLLGLGNPQDSYRTILIAGTNGKGSTAAMAASILQAAGYKTGLYTSPHLINVRERISVNKKEISSKDFSLVVAAVKKRLSRPATYFEVLTAAALLFFQRQAVDIAVLEVGLGGRLDATNICRPLVSVITNIGLDHTVYLGKTLKAIAREKAGIIKKRGVCITAAKQKTVLAVLEEICGFNEARLYRVGKNIKIKRQKSGLVNYSGLDVTLNDLTLPLLGGHQLDNAALALAAVEIAGRQGFPVDIAAIKKGLVNTRWPARLEILCQQPLFVVDGAHNPAGINVLCRALKNDFTYRRLILVFSALADKDYRKMLRGIAPFAGQIILTQLESNRALPVEELHECIKKMGFRAIVTEKVSAAVACAFDLAGEGDMICAAGSLYLAGEIKQAFPIALSCDKRVKI